MAGETRTCYDVNMEIGVCQPNREESVAAPGRGRTILLYLLGILLALGLFLLWMYHGFSPVVRGEYGEGVPPASAFCRRSDAFCLADESCTALGLHLVKIVTPLRVVPCLLIVRDTVPPAAEPVRVEFPSGHVPAPVEFIKALRDADRVGVSFAEEYDFSPAGEQTVRILLEDATGNTSEVMATAAVRATVERVIAEAGSPVPDAAPFLTEGFHGTLLDPITEEMMRTPGEYLLHVRCPDNGRIFSTTLTVRDTVPPEGSGALVVLAPGEAAVPEAFVTDAVDATALTYAFIAAPDPDSREIQDVSIRITDAGGNQTDVPAQALFSPFGKVTVEAKAGLLTGSDLGNPDMEPEAFLANAVGTYPIHVRLGEETGIAMVTLVDTTGPALAQREGPFYTRHDLSPEQLVRAEDVSAVTLSFLHAPDISSDQPQTFSVRAVDALDNETVSTFPLTLSVDTTPPVFYGVVNRSGYVNEPIAYLKEAYAEDEVDGRVELKVDSQVILARKGKYTVTYTATDSSGNTASKSCTYTLVEPTVTDEQIQEMARTILSDIITPDMVTAEKLKAVFDYVRGRVHYTGSSNKTDWRREAVRGYKEGRGDCFTVYALTRALLDELKIPYMSVTRKSTVTHHYWVIVNIGTGWYHYDPLVTRVHKHRCFMWTNQQCKVKSYFWRFHEENYPLIATERFDYAAVVQMERDGLLP